MAEFILQQLVDRSPDPIAAVDRSLIFVVANRAYRDEFFCLYGRSLSLGDSLRDLLAGHPGGLAEAEAVLARVFAGETLRRCMAIGQSDRRLYEVTFYPLLDPAGQVMRAGMAARPIAEIDLTELREAEQAALAARDAALKAQAEAERAEQTKSHVLAALGHDLRQPAQALMVLSHLLAERTAGTTAADLVQPMEQAVNALRLVLDGLLDISRLDAGVVSVRDEALVLGSLTDRLTTEYTPRAAETGLELHHVHCSSMVRTDAVLLERILRQLLENALRFTRQGRILVGCRHFGNRLAVEVLDTGVGIPDSERNMIFDEFYQLGNAARDRTQGLGLGLAVARRLAQLIGAEVRVSSVPGRGSRFTVLLPADQPRPGLSEPAAAYQGAAAGGVILVIDDEDMVRDTLSLLLERWGYRVVTAATGSEAVRLVTGGLTPGIILADYRLDVAMNGVQAVEAVRRCCGRRIPALIITGDVDSPGPCAKEMTVLYKPIGAEQLRREVARLSGAS